MKRNGLTVWMLILALACARQSSAHDTWVESTRYTIKVGEYTYIDLRLGNHGNNHRDFKLASKITLAPCIVELRGPDGKVHDLKSKLTDLGNAEKEGYWSARFVPTEAGVYEVVHSLDTLHGKTRAIKSSKTYFLAGDASEKQGFRGPEAHSACGLGLELVLVTPVHQLAANQPLQLRLLRNGKPLNETTVSFIPRGTTLGEGFDPKYERKTNVAGIVEFTPEEGNYILAVAHHVVPEESGEGFDKTHYGATMVLAIPQLPLSTK